MANRSSFLPRLSLGREDGPILPFHNGYKSRSPPLNKKPSEYDLAELSPRPEDAFLPSEQDQESKRETYTRRSSSPYANYSDKASTAGSASKMKSGSSRVLFAGPPPPIATSMLMFRDAESTPGAGNPPRRVSGGGASGAFAGARNTISSVLFDTGGPSASASRMKEPAGSYEQDTTWRSFQRREKALHREIQHLLDVQASGLAAHLDPNNTQPSSRSGASDAGSATPTGTFPSASASASRANLRRSQHISFDLEPHRGTGRSGEVIPVRQPRQKPMGLRAARAALGRNMTALADLRADEDAALAAALSLRKRALAQLRRLAARRDGISGELRALEGDDDEPLSRELRELGDEQRGVAAEIAELEERLVGLRNRKRWLDGRLEDVKNRREAGLSGYKGALKEVEGQVSTLLRRPPVLPLDTEILGGVERDSLQDGGEGAGGADADQSPGGVEFMHLRPERRTVEMARDWWEREVSILERRKTEVDSERAALEDGAEVWRETVQLVSDFETALRREMAGEEAPGSKGKGKPIAPEDAMKAQLEKMADVMAGLEQKMHTAEEKGWNLLIAAIGAEHEAFKEAESLLRGALHAAGFDDDPEEQFVTPAGSFNVRNSTARLDASRDRLRLVDLGDEGNKAATSESDNEVPADLLTGQQPDSQPVNDRVPHSGEQDDSENEVPPEFLVEHHEED